MRVFYIPLPTRRLRRRLLAAVLALTLTGLLVLSLKGIQELTPIPATGQSGDPVFQVDIKEPLVALTINVAWGEDFLPGLLAAFEDYGVKATFFIVGDWAEQFPDLTRNIATEGHELGNHSWSHPYPTQIPAEELKKEIVRTEKLLVELAGKRPALFAPPYGEWDKQVVQTAAEAGYRTIMWSVDTIDWQQPGVGIIAERVLNNIQPGGIVLMHPTEQTTQALPLILDGLKKKGLKAVTVSELLNAAS